MRFITLNSQVTIVARAPDLRHTLILDYDKHTLKYFTLVSFSSPSQQHPIHPSFMPTLHYRI